MKTATFPTDFFVSHILKNWSRSVHLHFHITKGDSTPFYYETKKIVESEKDAVERRAPHLTFFDGVLILTEIELIFFLVAVFQI